MGGIISAIASALNALVGAIASVFTAIFSVSSLSLVQTEGFKKLNTDCEGYCLDSRSYLEFHHLWRL